MSSYCKICDRLKAEYLSARKYLGRTREDFIIGTIIMIVFGGILELIVSRFFIALIRMTGSAPESAGKDMISSALSMTPGWWVMTSFVTFLLIAILSVMIVLFIGRWKAFLGGKKMLKNAIVNVDEKSCPNCRRNLPSVL